MATIVLQYCRPIPLTDTLYRNGLRWMLLLMALFNFSFCGHAQTDVYDIIHFTPPKGWKKEMKSTSATYTTTNIKNNSFCIIGIYKSMASTGDVEADFNHDWQQLVATPYQTTTAPAVQEVQEGDGWKVKTGTGQFVFSNMPTNATLTVMSGYNVSVAFLVLSNNEEFTPKVDEFFGTVSLTKPEGAANNVATQPTSPGEPAAQQPTANPSSPTGANDAIADGYKFTSTNFDDGWVSTIHPDWVQVAKGNNKVLLHFASGNGAVGDDVKTLVNKAWNSIVAPRYKSLADFTIDYNLSFEQFRIGSGKVTDANGQTFFVVLFQQGKTPWMEFTFPDKASFEQAFGVTLHHDDVYVSNDAFAPLIKMAGYNYFAVAPSDLPGTWTTNFSGMTQYVNVYTGANAGAFAHSSSQVFEIGADGSYQWQLSTATGMVGNQRFNGVKSNGKFSMPSNWDIHFSDIENKPKDAKVYFTVLKGARVLWIDGTGFAKK